MKLRILSVVPILVTVLAVAGRAQMPGPFSADIQVSSPRHDTNTTGKLYFSGDKARIDMSLPAREGGPRRGMEPRESVIINDLAQKVTYILMPQQHTYMEMRADEMPMRGRHGPEWRTYDPANPCANEPGVSCKKLGTEVVNGRTCDRWEFTGRDPDHNSTVWIDQKTHIPIKRQGADGTTFELTNIREGSQPQNLFEVPAGYQKMDMGGMMRGRRPSHE
jgi:hypothetical protein